jgi:hypothetical protein
LIATKKNLEAATLRGFYKLLPQLVGSFDPGGGVRGLGMPPGSNLSIPILYDCLPDMSR